MNQTDHVRIQKLEESVKRTEAMVEAIYIKMFTSASPFSGASSLDEKYSEWRDLHAESADRMIKKAFREEARKDGKAKRKPE